MKVIAIGELLIDFTESNKDEFGFPILEAHPGGAPANFLAAAAIEGMQTELIAKVGEDAFGKKLIEILKMLSISTQGVVIDPAVFTTLAFVTLSDKGDRSFSFARKPGADQMLKYEEISLDVIDAAHLVHFGTVSMTHNPSKETTKLFIELAKQKGKIISFDPNLRIPLWDNLEEAKEEMLWGVTQADIVKISEEEIVFLFNCDEKQGAHILIHQYHCKLVFVTSGDKGCYYSNGQYSGWFTELPKAQVKDTTGAGDIFGGTAIATFLKLNKSIEELTIDDLQSMVKKACLKASYSTEKLGGITSLLE